MTIFNDWFNFSEIFFQKDTQNSKHKMIRGEINKFYVQIQKQSSRACNFIEKETLALVNFAKFLGAPFLTEHLR